MMETCMVYYEVEVFFGEYAGIDIQLVIPKRQVVDLCLRLGVIDQWLQIVYSYCFFKQTCLVNISFHPAVAAINKQRFFKLSVWVSVLEVQMPVNLGIATGPFIYFLPNLLIIIP